MCVCVCVCISILALNNLQTLNVIKPDQSACMHIRIYKCLGVCWLGGRFVHMQSSYNQRSFLLPSLQSEYFLLWFTVCRFPFNFKHQCTIFCSQNLFFSTHSPLVCHSFVFPSATTNTVTVSSISRNMTDPKCLSRAFSRGSQLSIYFL